jgi:tetratricopeptide (TPR) repeat protein
MEQIVFGPFCMDVGVGRLLRDGMELDLRPQAFFALKALIRHTGRYVDYPQMIQEAWDGNTVSRHTVAVTVGEAKKVLREYGSWIRYRPKLGYRLEIPQSDDLIRKGWHFARRYTREGLERAIECFDQAARADSADARAFEGLSLCYLMLGAYGMRSPREMYCKFLAVHGRAVALSGLTAELRADHAHALHVFERRIAEAECELLQARQQEPNLVTVYGHLTVLYATTGRFEEAEDALAQARRADPLWPMLPSMEVLLSFAQRDFERAVAAGRIAMELHPYLPLGRVLYAQALEFSGQPEVAMEHYRLACVVSPEMVMARVEEAACFARNNRPQEAYAILEDLERVREIDYVDAYFMAVLRSALGLKAEALQELERAYEENSATLFILDMDPKLDSLRDDPRFGRLRSKVFGCSEAARVRAAS